MLLHDLRQLNQLCQLQLAQELAGSLHTAPTGLYVTRAELARCCVMDCASCSLLRAPPAACTQHQVSLNLGAC